MILLGKKLVPGYIERMALAIMNQEGYYQGSRSQRNNNPGNLVYASQAGTIGKDSKGFAIFDSFESGWNALIKQLKAAFNNTSSFYTSSMNLYQFFNVYASSSPSNERTAYAKAVAGALGVTPETTLNQIKGS